MIVQPFRLDLTSYDTSCTAHLYNQKRQGPWMCPWFKVADGRTHFTNKIDKIHGAAQMEPIVFDTGGGRIWVGQAGAYWPDG